MTEDAGLDPTGASDSDQHKDDTAQDRDTNADRGDPEGVWPPEDDEKDERR